MNCDPRYSPSNINYSDVYNAELHVMMYTGNTWRSGGIGACPYPYGLGVTGTQSLFILPVVVNRGTLSPAQIHSPCLTPIWYLFVPGRFLWQVIRSYTYTKSGINTDIIQPKAKEISERGNKSFLYFTTQKLFFHLNWVMFSVILLFLTTFCWNVWVFFFFLSFRCNCSSHGIPHSSHKYCTEQVFKRSKGVMDTE